MSDGQLLSHLLRFARLLRLMGVLVSLSQILEWVRALRFVDISIRDDFYFATRAFLITDHADYPLFDQSFQLYWRVPEPIREGDPPGELLQKSRARLPRPLLELVSLLEEEDKEEEQAHRSYSALERLWHKDFAAMSWEEMELARAALRRMDWTVRERVTRRMQRSVHGRQLDLRRLMRDNLRYGGEPLLLRWRTRKRERRPLVVLCDISGSMERYARMVLHFLHALTRRWGKVETFLFGTRLSHITPFLRGREVDAALDEVGRRVHDWSGGTRIGEALKTFNYEWARRVLGRGAIVLIISDGWDRGDESLLAKEMARLQRATYRLIWLNPLLGTEEYEPIQRGMAAALPFVDDFLPVHNLHSLHQLAAVLAALRSSSR
ncbi:MAG: VWA domain-containing protein [Ardenticatenales bacterium]|nr:VWA domain-containing protein [Ardenticatenales bacterium]